MLAATAAEPLGACCKSVYCGVKGYSAHRYGQKMRCCALRRPDFCHFEGFRLPIWWIWRAVGLLQQASRRPAGSSAEIAGVAGWSGVVVRERSGLDLAHEHLAQRLQSCDNVATALGNPTSLRGRAPLGGDSGRVNDILDFVRHAMQRTSWSCLVPYLCQRCSPLPGRFQIKPTLGPDASFVCSDSACGGCCDGLWREFAAAGQRFDLA